MKTIEVIDAPTNTNETHIPVSHGEKEKPKEIDSRRLRMMAEKVFGAVVNNMDDEGLQKYVKAGVSGDIEVQYNKLMLAESEAANPEFAARFKKETEQLAQNDPEEEMSHEAVDSIGAPTGFPETDDIQKELDEVGPVATSLRSKVMYQLGRPITALYSKMYDKTLAHAKYFKSLSEEEQQAHKEKVGRRATLVALGAAAIYGITKMNPLDMMPSASGTRSIDAEEFGGVKNATHQVELSVGGNAPDVEKPVFGTRTFEAGDFAYNPLEDPALSSAKKGNDFGPALRALPNDEAMKWPGGLSDLINDRWINSPEEFATVMSKLDLVDNNADAINSLGEKMKASPELYHENYAKVMEKLAKADISEQAITSPYGSYYAVNAGGNAVIAYDNYVDHGGTAIVIKVDGKEVWLRKDCGGQAIDLKPRTVSQPTYSEPTRTYTPPQETYTPPTTPDVPVVPENPVPPVIPPLPPIPPIEPPLPPIEPPLTPKSLNPLDYQAPGRDDTTDSGEGVKPQVGPDSFTPPPVVEQILGNIPGLSSSSAPSSEVDIPAPGSGMGSGIGQEGPAVNTGESNNQSNSGSVSSDNI